LVSLWARKRRTAFGTLCRVPRRIWLGVALAGLLAAGFSCGGGGSSSTTTTTTATTNETGNVSVTAVSGSLSHTTQVLVTVN
jgi:hypothetical protein